MKTYSITSFKGSILTITTKGVTQAVWLHWKFSNLNHTQEVPINNFLWK